MKQYRDHQTRTETRTVPKLGWAGMVREAGFRGPQPGLTPMGVRGAGGPGGVP